MAYVVMAIPIQLLLGGKKGDRGSAGLESAVPLFESHMSARHAFESSHSANCGKMHGGYSYGLYTYGRI